ncbi:MAG: hypothetical protein ACRYG8_34745 [Janthinobacterium lividum]
MALVVVGLGQNQTISQSETDTVAFSGPGTLTIAGTATQPIAVTLSQVTGGVVGSTVALSNANVTLSGAAGVSGFANYAIGSGGTLTLANTAGVSVASGVTFTGGNGTLVLANGVNVGVLGSIAGFAPGNTIDVSAVASSVRYADDAGTGTGGTLTLLDGNGQTVATLPLTTGEYVGGEFQLSADGRGGTLVRLGATVTGVSASPMTADVGPGAAVMLSVATSTPVTVTGGVPTLALNDGGTAVYDPAASSGSTLAFRYTVAPGENTADLAVVGSSLNGATVAGAGGVPLDLSGAAVNPAGVLQVDTTPPVVTGVVAMPGTADVGAGAAVMLSVTSSKPVTVTGGVPTLALNDGGTATYDPAASSGNTLAFRYTVAAGENTADLAVVGASLNGATVAGANGVPLDLAGAAVNPAGVLQVDTTAPAVTTVSVMPGTGTLQSGELIGVGVGTSEGVTVSGGTPTLSLSNGGTATYDPAASTPTMLVFTGMAPTDGSAAGLLVTGVQLNGSTISDPAGNSTDLSGAIMKTTNGGFTIGGGDGTGSAGTGAGGTGAGGGQSVGVYRFFDSSTGTHFFTADVNEKNTLMNSGSAGFRPDLKEEVNNFGAVNPSASGTGAETVYRFFDTVHGTHFFTASQTEANSLKDTGSSTYRADLVFEASSSFLEHSTQQVGDVAVYRFFDQTYGTHFYTGSQSEYAAITTPGTASFRADLVSEGVGFYAPAGSYS